MAIKVNDTFPSVTLYTSNTPTAGSSCKSNDYNTGEKFKGKTVVLFSVPGAFTPTCHLQHVPSFVNKFDELKSKGVDIVACVAPNDVHVLHHWGLQQNVGDKVVLLSDGNHELAKALGWEFDLTMAGMGSQRIQRGLIIIKDLKVTHAEIETGEGLEKSSAEAALAHL